MRLGFFGGSFDPPHRGHLVVALAAARAFSLDRVLMAPVGSQPLKPGGPAAGFGDRLAMTKLLCDGQPKLEASAIDAPLANGSPNFTIDTLARLQTKAGAETEIFVIVGADAFLSLRQWREPEELLRAAEWIVVSRPGFSREKLASLHLSAAQMERVHWLDGVAEPATATDLRARLREGADIHDEIPPAILSYIRAHHLYGCRSMEGS